jgi:hypothetical protein
VLWVDLVLQFLTVGRWELMMMLGLTHLGILVVLEVGEMVVQQTVVVVNELVCVEERRGVSRVVVGLLYSG